MLLKSVLTTVSCVFVFLISVRYSVAQEFDFQRRISPFPMQGRDGTALDFPFVGGFDAPRPQFVDIDGDEDPDLFIQEVSRTLTTPGKLIFFENTGSKTSYKYQWRTDWYKNLNAGSWYKFIDMDNDGDADLFTESPFSRLRYYRNDGGPFDAAFTVVADTLRDISGDDIFFDSTSLPDLADIDCDGDFDLFIGRQTGTISFYENTGSVDELPQFELITNQFEDIVIVGGGIGPASSPDGGSSRHGASGMTFADVDSDEDPDLFWGDVFEPSIVFLKNTSNCPNFSISITQREFPDETPVMSSGYNVPRFTDINGDGDLDMFVGILGGFVSSSNRHLVDNFLFFENTGSAQQPSLIQRTSRFITTFDIGSNALPAFADIDNDGDLDLFLGNDSDPPDAITSRLIFYRNAGSNTAPDFRFEDANFLDDQIFGFNFAPAFEDFDGDGDLDLLVGEWDGQLNLLTNNGSAQSPDFGNAVPFFGTIDVGNNASPVFVDIDADGDRDLFIGEFFGNINYYRNLLDSTGEMTFEPVTENYFNIGVDIEFGAVDTFYSVPSFHDVDNDGDFDLLVGFERGDIFFYRNHGSAASADFRLEEVFDLEVKGRAAPRLVDIDSDDDLDLFIGENRGGMLFYKNIVNVSSVDDQDTPVPEEIILHPNYPNPFNPETTVAFSVPRKQKIELSIYSVTGQKVRTLLDRTIDPGFREIKWDGKNDRGLSLPSGIYFCRLSGNGLTKTRRMVLLR